MSWLQIKIIAPQKLVEEWSDIVLTTGACAITLHDKEQQTIFEPTLGATPLWEQVEIIGLYKQEDIDLNVVKEKLYNKLGKNILLHVEIIKEEDWQNVWKKDLQPMKFGDNLWICPSWCTIPEPQATNIILDPGMAFGSGSHSTTALCLQWLAESITIDASMIDFGCGSGVLGIAAVKLGASFVYCVDCDPQALLSTKDNAEKNAVTNKQLVTLAPQELTSIIKTDIVIANILANPLAELAITLANHVKLYGNIVLSGILIEQAEHLITIYSQWFDKLTVTTKEEWVSISGIKKCA